MKNLTNTMMLALVLLSGLATFGQDQQNLKLWYNNQATLWNEALPIWDRQNAAMIFGAPAQEKLLLNESTLWAEEPSRNNNPDALVAIPQIRELKNSTTYYFRVDELNRVSPTSGSLWCFKTKKHSTINQFSKAAFVELYPNPINNGYLSLRMGVKFKNSDNNIVITNFEERIFFQEKLKYKENIRLLIGQLAKGTYLVSV
jgi:hypothetical protein